MLLSWETQGTLLIMASLVSLVSAASVPDLFYGSPRLPTFLACKNLQIGALVYDSDDGSRTRWLRPSGGYGGGYELVNSDPRDIFVYCADGTDPYEISDLHTCQVTFPSKNFICNVKSKAESHSSPTSAADRDAEAIL